MTTTSAAEEELMLGDSYGPESSHLNELMKKVRIAFCFCSHSLLYARLLPRIPPLLLDDWLAGWIALVCGVEFVP